MKAMLEFFDGSWPQILGFTLLHSLWESFLVFAIVILVLRFIPNKFSTARYITASLGLMTVVLLSIGTFIYLYATSNSSTAITSTTAQGTTLRIMSQTTLTPVGTYLDRASAFIHTYLYLFLMLWIFGTLLFSLRILTGLVYVEKLRRGSTLLQNLWSDRIQQIARQLNIKRLILLGESSAIHAPVIIGHLKPIILIPLGMCSSLSAEQLETIFLHEIMHIRRKDYLINLLQIIVEAIYFFNPFVWIVSGIMKREREHCCDDAVVQLHGNAKEYARALAALEESCLSKVGLALSLAENKNQLLSRIKRLMEKSVKNYSSRERIIPALLLVIGLVCASWISAQTSKPELSSIHPDKLAVVSDTIKKDKKIRKDKKAEAKSKEVSESQTPNRSDLELGFDSAKEFDTEYAFRFYQGPPPHIPVMDFEIHTIPEVAVMMMPPFPEVPMRIDSPGFEMNENAWKAFSKEFEEDFKAKFEDFYKKHQEDIQHMLEDVQNKVNSNFDKEWQLKVEDFAQAQEEWARAAFGDKWQQEAELLSQQDEHVQRAQESLEAQHREFERNRVRLEENMKAFEESNRLFEEKMKEQLIKDGYLGKDEKLETMRWQNGKIEINGKKIKAEDEKKYNEIHDKRFEGCSVLRKIPGKFE
jgi:bla regulator protein blaR1